MFKRLERRLRAWYDRRFRHGAVTRLRGLGLTAGDNLTVMRGAFIDPSHCWLITFGDDVTVARDAIVLAHDASMKVHTGRTRVGRVLVGDRVFIGASAIILPGVRIGDDVVIGAGSVVTRDVPTGSVVCGNPARVTALTDDWLERRLAEMNEVPCFGREYTEQGGVTPAMKAQMREAVDRFGYVV